MTLHWSNRAIRDLDEIHRYLVLRDPQAAAKIIQRLIEVARTVLTTMPNAGRPGRVAGTRELVVTRTPYILAYAVTKESIEIVAVIHTSRDWPEVF